MKWNGDPSDERVSNMERSAESVRREIGRSEPPSIAVVEAVAAITDRKATEVPSLYDYIDPDALDTAVESGSTGDAVSVSFVYDGLNVLVSDTHVTVERPA